MTTDVTGDVAEREAGHDVEAVHRGNGPVSSRPACGKVLPHDERFMRMALAMGQRTRGITWPNPSVGAVIVADHGGVPVVVGRGATAPSGRPHAEVMALRQAGEAARGATAYVTLEPCAHWGRTGPCALALSEAGVARVVIGISDVNPRVANKGVDMLRAAGVEVVSGVLEEECRQAHIGHFRRFAEGRPQVQLKLAVSADGFIGREGAGQVHITGPETQRLVHIMRAEADAIMVGIGTVLADDPMLDVRLEGLGDRSPVRYVLDSAARLPLDSQLVKTAAQVPVKVLTTAAAPIERTTPLMKAGIEIITVPADGEGRIDVAAALSALAHRGVTRLMVEGGAQTAGSFLRSGLVDEAVISTGPEKIGQGGIAPLGLEPLAAITENPAYARVSERRLGPDRVIHYRRKE
ncbi:bifunctional diaminohydroxyphosphoribosylaminopyrimidine deaminase/5-amino-6-(5-phosphoribosylamino)uracil reductase RibD [Breoghania sp.]|uniref:bifunctional diaminohydroxyphosphoribosylaminopyrimidine deaminase/5-amino-6-(5-phosphoribosylamino)uracil reductase RibD n=1 Tax=Breoghania sp. TaxID=2065378 RepID=UPI002AAA7AA3|nr:bifunctional diaminohydroxyphosphoribosylaminopyrimidine deaminase/5-amino-6-(5-phosphoribosylamino)uracil reductase RibD [Breoghania sp.]